MNPAAPDTDEVDRELRHAITKLGITMPDEWVPTVRDYLLAIRGASQFVNSFALPDEAEQAPVFEA